MTDASCPLEPGTWSAMPNYIRESGALKKITKAAARVYIALVLQAMWRDGGLVTIGLEALAELVGLDERSVRAGIAELTELGLVERLRRGGGRKGDIAVYRIENRKLASGSEPEVSRARTGRNLRENRKKPCREPEAGFRPIDTENREQSSRGAAAPRAAAADTSSPQPDAVVQAIVDAGLSPAKALDLAAKTPGLTPAIVAVLAKRAAAKGTNPPGLLVTMILDDGPLEVAKAAQLADAQRRRAEADKVQADAAHRETAKLEAEAKRRDCIIGALTDAELAQHVQAILKEQPDWMRRRWAGADPRIHKGLRLAIARRINGDSQAPEGGG